MEDFQDAEQLHLRQKPQVRRSVRTWRRVYYVPELGLAEFVPDKGEAIDLKGETAGLGVHQHRVQDVHVGKRLEGGKMEVIVTFYQIRAYA